MFKKKPETKAYAPVRSSDRRKLLSSILNQQKSTNRTITVQHGNENTTILIKDSLSSNVRLRIVPESIQSAKFSIYPTVTDPGLGGNKSIKVKSIVEGIIYIGSKQLLKEGFKIENKKEKDGHGINDLNDNKNNALIDFDYDKLELSCLEDESLRPLWVAISKWDSLQQENITNFNMNSPIIVPTVYSLWNIPYILPFVYIYSETFQFLQNGADLMAPGIIFQENATQSYINAMQKGSVIGIATVENPTVAVAVGVALVNLGAQLLPISRLNRHGKAIAIVNVIGDKLYKLAPIAVQEKIPSQVYNISPWDSYIDRLNSEKNISSFNIPNGQIDTSKNVVEKAFENLNKPLTNCENENKSVQDLSITTKDLNLKDEMEDNKSHIIQNIEIPKEEANKAPMNTTTNLPSSTEVEKAFEKALLSCLHANASGTEPIPFPIGSSAFMSNFIIPHIPPVNNKPADITTQYLIKRTSWKKASKFFKVMDKKGLIKVKDKGGDIITLSGIGMQDKRVGEFVPYKLKPPTKNKHDNSVSETDNNKNSSNIDGSTVNNSATSSEAAASKDNLSAHYIITEYYQPQQRANGLFLNSGLSSTGFYTFSDLRNILLDYINKHHLIDSSNKSNVKLDDTLKKIMASHVSKGSGNKLKNNEKKVKEAGIIGTNFSSHSSLLEGFRASCKAFYTIEKEGASNPVSGKGPKPKPGKAPKILVSIENRMGKARVVTKVSRLEPFMIDVDKLAEDLRVTCAGSSSITTTPANIVEIMVQGEHSKNVLNILEKKGIKPQWVEVQNSVKKK